MSEKVIPEGSSFSQSSLQDYMDCQRRFELRYLERLVWPAEEIAPALENEQNLLEGSLFHRLVHQHRLGLPAEKLRRLASTGNLARWWEAYARHDFGLGGWEESSEVTLSAPVGKFRLAAKYDLVALKAGEAVIYDWKTYHKRPRDERMAARMQTRVYLALLGSAGAALNNGNPIDPDKIRMIYWYAEFPDEPLRIPYSAAQFKQDWEMLTGLIERISRQHVFPLTDNEKLCAFCPYRSYCNRGIQPGEGEELDRESPEDEINFEQIQEIAF